MPYGPIAPTAPNVYNRDRRRAALGRVGIAGVIAAADLALAVIAVLVWQAVRHHHVSSADVASILLAGVSSTVGVPVLALIAWANVTAARTPANSALPRGRRLAAFGQFLALARLAGLLVAAVAVLLAVHFRFGLADAAIVGVATVDALVTVLLAARTLIAQRHTHRLGPTEQSNRP